MCGVRRLARIRLRSCCTRCNRSEDAFCQQYVSWSAVQPCVVVPANQTAMYVCVCATRTWFDPACLAHFDARGLPGANLVRLRPTLVMMTALTRDARRQHGVAYVTAMLAAVAQHPGATQQALCWCPLVVRSVCVFSGPLWFVHCVCPI